MNDPVTESRQNATPIADDVEVVETIEQANARRATNYLIAFATFVVVIGLLIVIEAAK